MSLLLVLALLVPRAAQAEPPPEDEIVVIARRFQQASVIVSKDAQGRFTCGLTVSSGNIRLDERLCRVASKCVIKGAADNATVKACIDLKKPDLFADFRREWVKANPR